MPSMELMPLFAVPVVRVQMPDADVQIEALRALFLQCESRGESFRNELRRDTQKGELFESRFDLFDWEQPEVRELSEFCRNALRAMLVQISDFTEAEVAALRFDYHAWFHVTRRGGYQGRHNHPNASWSGIFCVDPGDSDPDRPDSGAVLFNDTRSNAEYYSDAGNERLKRPYEIGSVGIQHRPGLLWLFPSYLYHEINPYLGDRPRIVVAFNCWINRLGPADA